MRPDRTIAEAARIALRHIGKPATVGEIYAAILDQGLYGFNTPTPEHVLRTEIRRKTDGVERVDSSSEVWFRMPIQELYEIMNEPSKPRRSAIGMKRIRRSSDKEQIIELLTSEAVGAFREMWRLMFFAAMVGFKNRRREPLAAVQAGEGIRQDSFANNPVWAGSLQLLALVELGSAEALRGTEEAEDERIRVFEEYANGGLAILKETFDATDSSLDGLLAFVQAQTSPSPPTTPELNVSI